MQRRVQPGWVGTTAQTLIATLVGVAEATKGGLSRTRDREMTGINGGQSMAGTLEVVWSHLTEGEVAQS